MGGAIFNHQGELTLLNSTLSGNTAVGGQAGPAADAGRGLGSAIFNLNGAVRIDYSTIAYNTADADGALYNLGYLADDATTPNGHTYSAHVVATGSIISPAVFSNAPETLVDGLQNTVSDPGDTKIDLMASNLIETFATAGRGEVATGPNTLVADPELGPLAGNGGATETHALHPDSPAIDKVNSSGGPTTDQRGVSRPQGAASDIGSFELEITDNTAPTVSSVTPTSGKTGVSRTPNITATFSEPVDKATVLDPTTQKSVNVKLTNTATDKQMGATVSCDADPCNKATITPNRSLAADTKYKATVTTGVKDQAGNALDQNPTKTGNQAKSWTFTTKR
jgi:Bacterial Ig-like domain